MVVSFYPIIIEKLFNEALEFAGNYANISESDRKILVVYSMPDNRCCCGKVRQWVCTGMTDLACPGNDLESTLLVNLFTSVFYSSEGLLVTETSLQREEVP